MVDALSRARRWLKAPSGRIIDLRPAHVVPDVELGLPDGSIAHVGGLLVDDERRQRHLAADLAGLTVVRRRVRSVTGEQECSFYRYRDSAYELRDYIAPNGRQAHLDAVTHCRAGEVVGSGLGA